MESDILDIKDIEKQFNSVAKKYDINREKFIPCFNDFYKTTTEFIASCINDPKRILDLGAGTGLLSYFWYQKLPKPNYVLVDIAEDMLKVAKERFCGLSNVKYETADYSKDLPNEEFDTVISALSIHHLEQDGKRNLFAKIYDKLPVGGVFVNYDQFCGGSCEMNRFFDKYWEAQLYKSGLSEIDIEMWKERRKLDRECSVEEEVDMLLNCKFSNVKCVYSSQKFAVIMAIK
ncbi:MAG: class I SAM-dependent methyltransferase [Clostridia bacterium]|nr:class I SAM-dependent methyltransferase [Clostridia bacterium]